MPSAASLVQYAKRGGPEDVRRAEYLHPDQGQHVRRHAHHPGGVHCVLPQMIGSFITIPESGFWHGFFNVFSSTHPVYIIFVFPADHRILRSSMSPSVQSGGNGQQPPPEFRAIPGYRPGKPTQDFIKRVLHKITFIGALFLGVIAVFPSVFGALSGIYGLLSRRHLHHDRGGRRPGNHPADREPDDDAALQGLPG